MNENEILKLIGKTESDKEVQMLLAENNFSLEKPKYFVESLYGDVLKNIPQNMNGCWKRLLLTGVSHSV